MNDFLTKVLPWVGAAATGGVPAIIGMAAKVVGEALGEHVDGTVEAITNAVTGATPEQVLLLKKADQEFQAQMQAMGFKHAADLEALANSDRDSARAREIALRDRVPANLAFVVTVGFFGVLAYILIYGIPEKGGDALLVMLGSLGTAWTAIVSYYFGSSAGSARKDVMLRSK
jgi:hypothetical protein